VNPFAASGERRVTDAERFPALHRAMASEAFDQDDAADDEFVFGLARVLDGVGALIAQRRGSAPVSRSRASRSARSAS
jgi:hypothetical protein